MCTFVYMCVCIYTHTWSVLDSRRAELCNLTVGVHCTPYCVYVLYNVTADMTYPHTCLIHMKRDSSK